MYTHCPLQHFRIMNRGSHLLPEILEVFRPPPAESFRSNMDWTHYRWMTPKFSFHIHTHFTGYLFTHLAVNV